MYKLLLLGTMMGVGLGIAKFMKKKKENVQEASSQEIQPQQAPASA